MRGEDAARALMAMEDRAGRARVAARDLAAAGAEGLPASGRERLVAIRAG